MRAPVRKGQDVARLHTIGQVGTDESLVAWQDREGDGTAVQFGLQVPGSLAYLGGVRLMLVLDPVGRADDGTDAGRHSETRHRNAGGHIR